MNPSAPNGKRWASSLQRMVRLLVCDVSQIKIMLEEMAEAAACAVCGD
jgi:hypothetical protein